MVETNILVVLHLGSMALPKMHFNNILGGVVPAFTGTANQKHTLANFPCGCNPHHHDGFSETTSPSNIIYKRGDGVGGTHPLKIKETSQPPSCNHLRGGGGG